MSTPVLLNLKYSAYVSLLNQIEKSFNIYKQKLLDLNIPLSHPSIAVPLTLPQKLALQNIFKKEVIEFSTINNFFNCLSLVNYHLGSLHQLHILFKDNLFDNVETLSISIEDLLIIESFKKL